MDNLTAEQANKLAEKFTVMAAMVADYRYANYEKLKLEEITKLENDYTALRSQARELALLSANLVMDEAESALASIEAITSQMDQTYKNLENVQKAIDVAAALVTLGAAIISKNPQTIVTAIGGLANNWGEGND